MNSNVIKFLFILFLGTLIQQKGYTATVLPDPLEGKIKSKYSQFRSTPGTALRKPVQFIGSLAQELEGMLQKPSSMKNIKEHREIMLKAIFNGVGVGGLKKPKFEGDTSYKLNDKEKRVVRQALMLVAAAEQNGVGTTMPTRIELYGIDKTSTDEHMQRHMNVAYQIMQMSYEALRLEEEIKSVGQITPVGETVPIQTMDRLFGYLDKQWDNYFSTIKSLGDKAEFLQELRKFVEMADKFEQEDFKRRYYNSSNKERDFKWKSLRWPLEDKVKGKPVAYQNTFFTKLAAWIKIGLNAPFPNQNDSDWNSSPVIKALYRKESVFHSNKSMIDQLVSEIIEQIEQFWNIDAEMYFEREDLKYTPLTLEWLSEWLKLGTDHLPIYSINGSVMAWNVWAPGTRGGLYDPTATNSVGGKGAYLSDIRGGDTTRFEKQIFPMLATTNARIIALQEIPLEPISYKGRSENPISALQDAMAGTRKVSALNHRQTGIDRFQQVTLYDDNLYAYRADNTSIIQIEIDQLPNAHNASYYQQQQGTRVLATYLESKAPLEEDVIVLNIHLKFVQEPVFDEFGQPVMIPGPGGKQVQKTINRGQLGFIYYILNLIKACHDKFPNTKIVIAGDANNNPSFLNENQLPEFLEQEGGYATSLIAGKVSSLTAIFLPKNAKSRTDGTPPTVAENDMIFTLVPLPKHEPDYDQLVSLTAVTPTVPMIKTAAVPAVNPSSGSISASTVAASSQFPPTASNASVSAPIGASTAPSVPVMASFPAHVSTLAMSPAAASQHLSASLPIWSAGQKVPLTLTQELTDLYVGLSKDLPQNQIDIIIEKLVKNIKTSLRDSIIQKSIKALTQGKSGNAITQYIIGIAGNSFGAQTGAEPSLSLTYLGS